ncbi:hypothetical protein BJ508DRAFT_314263 [Ascobolus immersus RN42]|uniref:Uncharacterized protein n=1 Tax=Ascobolus immersus RN42 TaxID=1160509 RepID=A0A3N4HHH1_ASCIM|nr:hypothetical protein BJ508DRAFT_314263 [Ascobolus immersus RN42]
MQLAKSPMYTSIFKKLFFSFAFLQAAIRVNAAPLPSTTTSTGLTVDASYTPQLSVLITGSETPSKYSNSHKDNDNSELYPLTSALWSLDAGGGEKSQLLEKRSTVPPINDQAIFKWMDFVQPSTPNALAEYEDETITSGNGWLQGEGEAGSPVSLSEQIASLVFSPENSRYGRLTPAHEIPRYFMDDSYVAADDIYQYLPYEGHPILERLVAPLLAESVKTIDGSTWTKNHIQWEARRIAREIDQARANRELHLQGYGDELWRPRTDGSHYREPLQLGESEYPGRSPYIGRDLYRAETEYRFKEKQRQTEETGRRWSMNGGAYVWDGEEVGQLERPWMEYYEAPGNKED